MAKGKTKVGHILIDVFIMDELMLEDWTETCSNRIICISLVDGCNNEAIKKCIDVENIITITRPTQISHPEAAKTTHPPQSAELIHPPLNQEQKFKKVSDFPVPRPKLKRTRGAEKQKAEFLKAMDKTYFFYQKAEGYN